MTKKKKKLKKHQSLLNGLEFYVITVFDDGLAPLGARTSASQVNIYIWAWISNHMPQTLRKWDDQF